MSGPPPRLFYGDETGISELAYVPYGWQLKDENLAISANHGGQINCFGILSRTNALFSKITTETINADFIVNFFEDFSFKISKQTVVILDNARIHIAQKVKSDRRSGTNQILAKKRSLYRLFTPLLTTLKYYRKTLEGNQSSMVKTRGLCFL